MRGRSQKKKAWDRKSLGPYAAIVAVLQAVKMEERLIAAMLSFQELNHLNTKEWFQFTTWPPPPTWPPQQFAVAAATPDLV